jgi:hypothetical protein
VIPHTVLNAKVTENLMSTSQFAAADGIDLSTVSTTEEASVN